MLAGVGRGTAGDLQVFTGKALLPGPTGEGLLRTDRGGPPGAPRVAYILILGTSSKFYAICTRPLFISAICVVTTAPIDTTDESSWGGK